MGVLPARDREADERPAAADLRFELVWWLHPVVPIAIFGLAVTTWVALAGDASFDSWGVPHVFTLVHYRIAVVGALVMVLGSLLAAARAFGRRSAVVHLDDRQVGALQRLEKHLFVLVVLAYLAWLLIAVRGGATSDMVLAVLHTERGAVSSLKDVSAPVAGVTTLTQLGPVMVAVSILLRRIRRVARPSLLWVVLLLTAGRALFYGERLALVEVAVPAVLVLAVVPAGLTPRVRVLVRALPTLGLPALWLLFAAFEYSRSWAARDDGSYGPFDRYVTNRLLGYYGTSVNNSAIYYDAVHGTSHLAFYPVQGLWEFPFLGKAVGAVLGTPTIGDMGIGLWWRAMVEEYANPEFINTGTFLVLAGDLGVVGMALYAGVLGLAVGTVYVGVARGSVVALVAYSCAFVGLLELARILYFGQGRFFVTCLGVVWLAVVFGRASRPAPSPTRPPSSGARKARVP